MYANNGYCRAVVSRHKAWVSAQDKRNVELSNLMMDGWCGGRIRLSGSQYSDFLDAYARDIESGIPQYVVECRSAVFRFHLDLDLEVEPLLDDEQLHRLIQTITRSIKAFYKSVTNDTVFRVLASVAEAKPTKDGFHKQGVHLVYPDILVRNHEALLLRESIVSELHLHHASICLRQSWDTVVDKAIFANQTTGLRMLGSVKRVMCPNCTKGGTASQDTCEVCASTGKVDELRPYKMWAVYNGDGTIDEDNTRRFKQNLRFALEHCSIRTCETTPRPVFERPVGAPSYIPLRSVTNGAAYKLLDEFPDDRQTTSRWKRNTVHDPAIRSTCESLIRRVNRSKYGRLFIRDVSIDNARAFYDIKVGGVGSSYCQNKGGDHNQNTIYFRVDRKGVAQRCFCKCNVIRLARVTCSKYASPHVALGMDEVLVLFPPSKDARDNKKHTGMPFDRKRLAIDEMRMSIRPLDAK